MQNFGKSLKFSKFNENQTSILPWILLKESGILPKLNMKIRLVFYLVNSRRSHSSDNKHENQTSIYPVTSRGSQSSNNKHENQTSIYLVTSRGSQGSDNKHENQTSIYLVTSRRSQGSDHKHENQTSILPWILPREGCQASDHKHKNQTSNQQLTKHSKQ